MFASTFFSELMDKTRSQMGELDPIEASVNHKDIFKKNLEEMAQKKQQQEQESDEDSGYDVRSISTSGGIRIIISMRITLYFQTCVQEAGLWRIIKKGWNSSIKKKWKEGKELKNICKNKMILRQLTRNCSILFKLLLI